MNDNKENDAHATPQREVKPKRFSGGESSRKLQQQQSQYRKDVARMQMRMKARMR